METIDLVATATQILELLSDQGISGKSLHAYLSIDEQGLKQCALPLLSHRKAGG